MLITFLYIIISIDAAIKIRISYPKQYVNTRMTHNLKGKYYVMEVKL
jgi:hypothetical protein